MKNSKIKVGLVALLMSTGLLVGCNSGPNIGPEEKPHEHALVSVDAKDATYYEEGNIKYYYCPECNKKFSDSTGTTEISDEDVILKKKTILEETTEVQKEDVEPVLQQAVVANGTSKFVSLEGDVTTGLYVSNNKQGDYTTITLSLSLATDNIVAFEFDYRYLDNCNDREYDMLGHNYISTKVSGESESTFVPHTNGKLNKDCAWHTFSYHEADNLKDDIEAFEINIYHFDGELVINNVYVIHEVAGTTGDPSTVAHYEDLEGGVYWYDYDNDEYISVNEEDINITLADPGVPATCEHAGYKAYYFCEYTREYYEDKDGDTVIEDINAWKAPGGEGYLAPTHTMTEVPGQEATCTAAGYKDAYYCSVCKKYYSDEEGLELIGDGSESAYTTWKTTGDGKIEALGHNFDENGNCTRCSETVKDYLSLEDASAGDLLNQISLSNIGVSASDYVTITGEHIFGTYDIYGAGGIDLKFNLKYTAAANSYVSIYFGNGRNEEGLQLRLMTHGEPSVAYLQGYYFSTAGGLVKENGQPFYSETTTDSYFLTKPGETTDNIHEMEIKLTPYEPAQSNANEDFYKVKIAVDGYVFKKAEGQPDIDDLVVGFPAGYFRESGTVKHNTVRFSYTGSGSAAIKEAEVSNPAELIMLDGDGNVLGKKSDFTNPITLPELHKENNKFVGWFDTTGERMNGTVTSISKKTVIRPIFVESQDNMYVPSDFTWDTKGKELHPTGEAAKQNANIPKEATRIDVYFIIKPTFTTTDNYFYFSLPYDMTDGKTRVEVRVSLNANNSWYWNSSSSTIGGAGASTSFKPTGLTWTSGVNYLFHIYVKELNSIDTPYEVGFDVTNLIDLTSYEAYKDFKFNENDTYKVSDSVRSKLGFRTDTGLGSADFSVTDAW